MSGRRWLLLAVALLLGVVSLQQVAIDADDVHVALIAGAVFEYRAAHDAWPTRIEDLAGTSLPVHAPYDLELVRSGRYVVCWPGADPAPDAVLVLSRPLPLRPFSVAAARLDGVVTRVGRDEGCPP